MKHAPFAPDHQSNAAPCKFREAGECGCYWYCAAAAADKSKDKPEKNSGR